MIQGIFISMDGQKDDASQLSGQKIMDVFFFLRIERVQRIVDVIQGARIIIF